MNTHPQLAAYQAMMFNHLVAFKKELGVHLLGISEILRRVISRCVLRAVDKKVIVARGMANLSAGLSAGIEAAIHIVTGRAQKENLP